MDILLRISAVLMMVGVFLYALLQMLIAFIVMYWFAIAAVAVAVIAYKIHGRRSASAASAVPGWEPHPAVALPRPVHPVGAAVAPIYRPVASATTGHIGARAVPPRPRR
jgi:hypothetical protein